MGLGPYLGKELCIYQLRMELNKKSCAVTNISKKRCTNQIVQKKTNCTNWHTNKRNKVLSGYGKGSVRPSRDNLSCGDTISLGLITNNLGRIIHRFNF